MLPRFPAAPAPAGVLHDICQFCSTVVNAPAPFCHLGIEPGASSSHTWCDACKCEAAATGAIGYVRLYLASYLRWHDVRLLALYQQARYTLHAEKKAARRLRRAAH